MFAAVYSLQFHSSTAADLNCSHCSKIVVVQEKLPVLHKPRLNIQPSDVTPLHKLQFLLAAALFCSLRLVQYI